MPIVGDKVVCYLCGAKASLQDVKKRVIRFSPYRSDFACSMCIDEIREDVLPVTPPDAPSPDDLKEIEPYLDN